MKTVTLVAAAIFLSACAHAVERSPADSIANATYVPPPSALPSMPASEWCKTVDAALANPNTDAPRKEEYIAVGQAQHCEKQMLMEPRKRVDQAQSKPEDFCVNAFKILGNPYADQYLKAATLEKARNRGCLR